MIKKIMHTLLVTILLCLTVNLTQTAFAEEEPPSLVTDLVYDQENHVLTGKTAPNANVSLADIVANITANEDGTFSVPIPEDLKQTTITIMDFLNDQSTDINYDFVAGSTATEETVVQSSSSLVQSTSQPTATSSSQVVTDAPPETPKKENAILIWVLVLVVIVILTILVLFLINKRKAEKKQAEAALKANRSGRRKKRRKKPTE